MTRRTPEEVDRSVAQHDAIELYCRLRDVGAHLQDLWDAQVDPTLRAAFRDAVVAHGSALAAVQEHCIELGVTPQDPRWAEHEAAEPEDTIDRRTR